MSTISVPTRYATKLERALELLNDGRPERARTAADAVLAREPDNLAALRIAGHAALRLGASHRAFEVLLKAAKLAPQDIGTLDALATAAEDIGERSIAQEALECAVAIDATEPARFLRLAQIHFSRGQLTDAHGYLLLTTSFDADNGEAHATLGDVLVQLDRLDEALTSYRRARELMPDDTRLLIGIANVLDALERPDEAYACRRQAQQEAPTDPAIAFQTKGIRRYTADDPDLLALQAAVDTGTIPPEQEPVAHLALAKMYDDADQLERAARHLVRGNRLWQTTLRRRKRHYDPDRAAAEAQATIACVRAARDRHGPPTHAPTTRTLLITGLPRAGKSLLEHLVTRHPDLGGVGESTYLAEAITAAESLTGQPYPVCLVGLDADQRTHLLTRHVHAGLEAARQHRGGLDGAQPTVVVSAHPAAAIQAGVLAVCDPTVVLVFCERDPRDLLLANYLQWFPNSQPFAFDPASLIAHWTVVQDLMDGWAELLGDRFLRVSYERSVADPAASAAAVLDALDLPRNDACTLPRRHDAEAVTTSPTDRPSYGLGVHAAHIGIWRRWRPFLPDLFDPLEQAGLVDRYLARRRDDELTSQHDVGQPDGDGRFA